MYDMSGFSYDITDVVHLLQLRVRHKNSSSMDVNCPFCGETKGKMNVNLQKNVFRCNRCDASGGMLELYGRLHGVSSAEANRQIREALGKGEYRTDYQVVHKEEPVEIFNAELADADVIDRTYQEMLSLLTLNDKHQEDLKKRGLTKEQIEIQRYRSVPLFGIKNMVQKLLESGQTVKGVPGFYEDQDGKWTINFTSKNSGILIPIRSMEGKIQGFQIRLDQVMEGRKYIWLSSVKFQNGVSSGSPVHVIGSLDAEQIYLTEGALKGTIAHYLSGDTFICVAGVNQYRNLKPVLETLKSRHLQHLSDILVYISVLPIIIVCAFAEGKSLLGVAVAFIYGYFATMEGSMLNWFPIKAAMILVDPKCGSEYGITYKIPPAAMSIIGVLVVSILLFQMLNRTKKNVYMKSKRKVKVKQTRRKGW